MSAINGKILALLCGVVLFLPATQWAQSAPVPTPEARKGPATPPPLFFIDGVKQTPPQAATAAEPTPSGVDTRSSPAKLSAPALLASCAACAGLRPEDIASVEVLKGAKALELYGVEATYGVVLIVTKQGAKKP